MNVIVGSYRVNCSLEYVATCHFSWILFSDGLKSVAYYCLCAARCGCVTVEQSLQSAYDTIEPARQVWDRSGVTGWMVHLSNILLNAMPLVTETLKWGEKESWSIVTAIMASVLFRFIWPADCSVSVIGLIWTYIATLLCLLYTTKQRTLFN